MKQSFFHPVRDIQKTKSEMDLLKWIQLVISCILSVEELNEEQKATKIEELIRYYKIAPSLKRKTPPVIQSTMQEEICLISRQDIEQETKAYQRLISKFQAEEALSYFTLVSKNLYAYHTPRTEIEQEDWCKRQAMKYLRYSDTGRQDQKKII